MITLNEMKQMSSLSLFSFFFILLSLFLPSHSTTSECDHHILIPQLCKNISNSDPNISYKFCTSSLLSDPHHSRCMKNLDELGLYAIKLLRQNVSDTRVHIKDLLKMMKKKEKKSSLDPFVKECLKDCLEVYSDTKVTLRDAIKDYKAKRYGDCSFKVSSVLDASTTCEDGFGEKNGVVSPLTKRNKDTFQLSAIVLSIVNMINK